MLIGLNDAIQKGQTIKIDLTFEDGSSKTIHAKSRSPMEMDDHNEMNHHHHHDH